MRRINRNKTIRQPAGGKAAKKARITKAGDDALALGEEASPSRGPPAALAEAAHAAMDRKERAIANKMRETLSTAGVIAIAAVVSFCETEGMELHEVVDLGTAWDIASALKLKKGDAVRLHRLSDRLYKQRTHKSRRKYKKLKVHPENFNIDERFWLCKGSSKNLLSPEREWLKAAIRRSLEENKIQRVTAYNSLNTDQESKIKTDVISAQLSAMSNAKISFAKLPPKYTDSQYEAVFSRVLTKEICILMEDRVKSFKRSKAGKAYEASQKNKEQLEDKDETSEAPRDEEDAEHDDDTSHST